MDKVFFDTDVCLDLILKRDPFEKEAYPILDYSLKGKMEIFYSEGSIPNFLYIGLERYKLKGGVDEIIYWVSTYNLISADQKQILNALKSSFKDKEDAYQYFTALHNDMDYLITRNKKDYEPYATAIPVYTPSEFLAIYDKS